MMIDVGILLQKADIEAAIAKLGIQFEKRQSKRGHELYFLCPTQNHDGTRKTMSISVSGKYKGFFNCWACGFQGNLVHLIRHILGCDFKSAVEYLEQDYGSAKLMGTDGLIFNLKMAKEEDEKPPEFVDLDMPNGFKLLTDLNNSNAENAKRWLSEERHIGNDMIKKYEIGMVYHMKIGFAVTIPVRFNGRLLSIFYAQPFKGGLKLYPKNSPQGRILFNYEACLKKKEYVMMESILDVIKYDSVLGDETAMACFTNMISDEQLELLKVFETHGIMPDLDGYNGWELVNRMIPTTGKATWIYFCPLGKDPGDCTPEELQFAKMSREMYCDYESRQIISQVTKEQESVTCIRKK